MKYETRLEMRNAKLETRKWRKKSKTNSRKMKTGREDENKRDRAAARPAKGSLEEHAGAVNL
jgi:hypothetical protein